MLGHSVQGRIFLHLFLQYTFLLKGAAVLLYFIKVKQMPTYKSLHYINYQGKLQESVVAVSSFRIF